METDSIPCFNTSHVTLYPTSGWDLTSPVTFQYISCYSLSEMVKFDYYAIYMFQYISCYSLSVTVTEEFVPETGFNTSHVTLYPQPFYDRHQLLQSFNTSHVTLYLLWINRWKAIRNSFNTSHVTLYRFPERNLRIRIQFQYISCYSLSESRFCMECGSRSFNTSHVTLYQQVRC